MEIEIVLSPEQLDNREACIKAIAQKLTISDKRISDFIPIKRSIDARGRQVKIRLRLEVFLDGEKYVNNDEVPVYRSVHEAQEIIVVGCGPAGMFAALRLLELGLKPIVLERGKDVKSRRRDLAAINKQQIVNPESNYCFGEGGAGTYSDGKLFTRSTKRGDVKKVIEALVYHGADPDILVDAHPHIGTNKLPKIIVGIRETILKHGGEIHFTTKVVDLLLEDNQFKGIKSADGEVFMANHMILATGHSARDIFTLLHQKGIEIESKPFAVGFRVEHDQRLIDQIQYHCENRSDFLPPASYRLVEQVNGRGVYSFCMCPGGIIAPCATSPGEVVTNGWSPSRRNNPFANSGIVVSIEERDLTKYKTQGALAGMTFQSEMEKKAHDLANPEGLGQKAPAQRLVDYLAGRKSQSLPESSYVPGLTSVDLNQIYPQELNECLRKGFEAFGRKMQGFINKEALLVGVETRTSSPVRIPRDRDRFEHPQIKGLYPCGEGAGYAGGIMSAAIDGIKCAEFIAAYDAG